MKEKEILSIISDIQASPKECEWIEIKCNNKEPHMIGEYISANDKRRQGQSVLSTLLFAISLWK